MSNELPDQAHETREQAMAAPTDTVPFSIWWPQTKPSSDLWKLLLCVAATLSASYKYLSLRHFFPGHFYVGVLFPKNGTVLRHSFSLLVSAVVGAVGWYIILVVVRYLAYWFSGARKR